MTEKLSLIWDKRQKDFVVKYPRQCDGNLVMGHIIGDVLKWDLGKVDNNPHNYSIFNLKNELEKRGYDTSTLKFSIEKKRWNKCQK